jgi:hypothetical protein
MKIYLCGPIDGCTDADCKAWREHVKKTHPEYEYVDPMRRDFRGRSLEHSGEIVQGDKEDILSCNMVLAYSPRPSYGTAMEIFFAWENDIPVIVVIGLQSISPWIYRHASAVCSTLKEAFIWLDNVAHPERGDGSPWIPRKAI